ncbi:glutamine-hydrolyzing GMP synthase [Mycoplasmatota bacterium]|nr:glutamine-hydrolyzing GMP synthase [Mycoplasmatota bacterium]
MDKIVILDFGSQYNQLIARRVREIGVYSEVVPFDKELDYFNDSSIKGIILSGGPNSVYDEDSPKIDKQIFNLGVPVLGICYGMQITQYLYNGKISPSKKREYGKSTLNIVKSDVIFDNVKEISTVWMSHGDHVDSLSSDFHLIANTDSCFAAAKHNELNIYNLQFHPEVTHSEFGHVILHNFVIKICGASANWSLGNYIDNTVASIKKTVGNKRVILALSGGVDSSVAAVLVHKAIGDQLTCIFVDTGLMRKDERIKVMETYGKNFHMNIKAVDAEDRFLDKLKGVKEPEQKRKIIGNEFIEVFNEEKYKFKDADFLAQGTIYPDVIESTSIKGPSSTIKSHHNVGGLPEEMEFELLEPLRELFKDEVRRVGIELGIPEEMVMRHPFPGPGLGIRVIEEVTKEKVRILQEADDIFINELIKEGLYQETSQAFVTLLPCKTVGVMGDNRTYEFVAAVRSVNTSDFMTASFSRLPFDFLDRVSTMIINQVKGINRVVYDITSKPPGTIEWE